MGVSMLVHAAPAPAPWPSPFDRSMADASKALWDAADAAVEHGRRELASRLRALCNEVIAMTDSSTGAAAG